MKYAMASACLALSLLPGCFDSLVGTQCADDSTTCCTSGGCTIDGGYDLGAVGWMTGETAGEGVGTAVVMLDADESLDLGTSLDLDGETQAATLDEGDDLALDQMNVGRQDARVADASDVGFVKSSDAAVDLRDSAVTDTRDSASDNTADARDATKDPGGFDTDGAGSKDAADLAKAPSDAADVPAVKLDTATADSTPEAQTFCSDPQALCNGACVDLQTDQANCGRCGYDCSPRICINALCYTCPSGQTACNGQCTDTLKDPSNCGGCSQLCTTGACRYGVCKASTAGHIVVLGHDFLTSNTAMNQILGNAIFLATADPVQLAEYVGVASTNAVSNSHVAISVVATSLDRSVVRSLTSAGDIVSQLTSADVFLIQSQTLATNSILMQLGQSWTDVLTTFVATGGIIVLLDGSYPVNNGTTQILSQAGLTTIFPTSVVTNDTCSITAADDPLANALPTTYSCLQDSISFSGNGVHVVEALGQPVVLHMAF